MKVTENENKEIVKKIREGLEKTGGYCPCRIQRTPENKCMCEEFRRQIADPDFEGYCHCLLYYKSKKRRSGLIHVDIISKPCYTLVIKAARFAAYTSV